MGKKVVKKGTCRIVAAAIAAVVLLGAGITLTTDSASASAFSTDPLFESDYGSKAEAIEAGLELNEQIAEEGMILVKNENNALPLYTGLGTSGAKVSVFGFAGVEPDAGSTSGGDTSAGSAIAYETVYSSLEDVGFKLNPVVKEQYETWLEENPSSGYPGLGYTSGSDRVIMDEFEEIATTSEWRSSIEEYNDAAIIVLSEGTADIGNGDGERTHYLQLDDEQLELVDYVTSQNFDKVIVLINSTVPIEMAEIQNDDGVDAILIIGEGGDNGFAAIGKILSGEVNPSGRLPDTWAADFTAMPAYTNYNVLSSNNYTASAYNLDGEGTATGYSTYRVDGTESVTYSAGYEEGIYVGYRWYETAYAEIGNSYNPDGYTTGDDWYDDAVVYSFGYGLSYTTFEWEITPDTAADSNISSGDTLAFNVKVTNTGDYAGKEVVQLYYTAPYTGYDETYGVEKAHVNLGDYAKTDILQPGQSQTVRVEIDVNDMASYDYANAKTYILDPGEYTISIASSAHAAAQVALGESADDDKTEAIGYTIAGDDVVECNTAITGVEITNQFDDVTEGFEENYTAFTRADFDGTFPGSPEEYIDITSEEYEAWEWSVGDYDGYYSDVYNGTTEVVYAEDTSGRTSDTYSIVLSDMIGADVTDERYQEMVEQLTLEEMVTFINNGGFNSLNIDYLGVPFAFNTDGPKGWTGSGTDSSDTFNYFATEPLIAATFNKELAYELGKMIGEQGLWGNSTQASGVAYSYTGWYAPGMNIHRSPFDIRYTEYYSEDPVLTGYTAANASLGAQAKGAYITMKHFAFHNDGGGIGAMGMGDSSGDPYRGSNTDQRGGLSAWMTEQTAREIYLTGYQICVEEGEADYMMSSFTRVGTTWSGGSYALNTKILREEWGFDGASVTDICSYMLVDAYQLVEAGAAGIMLNGNTGNFLDVDEINAIEDEGSKNVLIYCMQQTVKHNMYLVANSNAMQIPAGAAVVYNATTENEYGEEVELTLSNATVGEEYTSTSLYLASLNTSTPYSEISYTVTGLPDGMSIDTSTGVISGTPTTAGTYQITVTATAPGYTSASHTFTLIVEADEATGATGDIDGGGDTGDIDGGGDTGDIDGGGDTGDIDGGGDTGTTTESSSQTGLMVTGIVLICVGVVAIVVAIVLFVRRPKKS